MELVWDFARILTEGAQQPGISTNYSDQSCQAIFLKNQQLQTMLGDASLGRWQNVSYSGSLDLSAGGYTQFDATHIKDGLFAAAVTKNGHTHFLIYEYDKANLPLEPPPVVLAPPLNPSFCLDPADTNCYPGSGTVVHDISTATSLSGSMDNGLSYSTLGGGSFALDGVDDVITFNNVPKVNTDITLIVWMRPTSFGESSYGRVCEAIYCGASLFLDNNMVSNGFAWWTGSDAVRFGGTVSLNTWQQLVVTQTGANVSVYVNGVYRTGASSSAALQTSAGGTLYIGDNPAMGRAFAGNIAIFQTFDRVLSASEIDSDFQRYRSRFGL